MGDETDAARPVDLELGRGSQLFDRLDRLVRTRPVAGGSRPAPVVPPSPREARATIELAARVGEVALTSGASAADTTTLILRVLLSQNVRAHVDVTYTAVHISYRHPDDLDPISRMRTVGALGMDYDLLGWLERRVEAVAEGRITVGEADELLRTRRSRPLYRTWARLLAAGFQGVAIALLLGGRPGDALLAGLSTLLVDVAVPASARRGLPVLVQHIVAGAIPTSLGLITMALLGRGAVSLGQVSPSLIIATGMVTMLAGMGVVAATQDALDGFYVTAAARVLDFFTRTGGLVLGVAGTLWLGLRLGVPLRLAQELHATPPPAAQVAVVFISCALFATLTLLGPRAALACGVLGAAGWTLYLLAHAATGVHEAAAGLMAFAVAVVARLVTRPLRVPVMAMVTVSTLPLMPGLMMYRALFGIVNADSVLAGDRPDALLVASLLTGIALSTGASLGVMLGRRLVPARDRFAWLANSRVWARGSGHRPPPSRR